MASDHWPPLWQAEMQALNLEGAKLLPLPLERGRGICEALWDLDESRQWGKKPGEHTRDTERKQANENKGTNKQASKQANKLQEQSSKETKK